jgi:hypothetical protein
MYAGPRPLSVICVLTGRERNQPVDTYVVVRRNGWRTAEDFRWTAARSSEEAELMPEDIDWVRSYVLEETDGSVGAVCVYQASSPEAVRAHAVRAGLPIDEIVKVLDTVVMRPDPFPVAA